ncbi:MAG: 1,2-phenylacetyl-CoA epoxidase subunit B [Actinomycetota bacterium]|nr:1,2-phenylacetyl-CoA epoxidase subunit B [Actinomycetota bacterium]
MKVYEVFLKRPGKNPFEHVGSLEAPDDEMAAILARESYVRRGEGEVMWLLPRAHLIEVPEAFLKVNEGKEHRFNDGSVLAERRRQRRAE